MLDYRFRAAAGSRLFRLLKGAYIFMWNKIVEKFLEKLIKKHFGLSAGISVDHMEVAENKETGAVSISFGVKLRANKDDVIKLIDEKM